MSKGYTPLPVSDYAEKLKDPRWQKKRLEIFQRDNWTCKKCGEKNKIFQRLSGMEPPGAFSLPLLKIASMGDSLDGQSPS